VVAPGGEDSFFEGALSGFCKDDACAAFAAPGSVDGTESGGMRGDEVFLLDGSEFDHGGLFVGIREGGENSSGYAEVGMVHVFAFFGLGEA